MNQNRTTLASGYTGEGERRPVSEHFTRPYAIDFVDISAPPAVVDPLGFNYQRLLQGEEDVKAGRFRPLREAMDALRARISGHRD